MTAASAEGKLSAGLMATYFTTPRPVYELYDLEADPSELNNLSGSKELAAVETELRLAMAEKMLLDYDYLPLPAMLDAEPDKPAKPGADRRQQFQRLDTNQDGQLSRDEFGKGREPTDAEKWFLRRDADQTEP
jgi:hypothetical protein